MLTAFRREFQRIADAKLNLVLSAEDLAYLDGDGQLAQRARAVLLHDLLAPFAGRVTAVLVYRTPRAAALQSLYTEDRDWARDGVETASDAHAPLSSWLAAKLHGGTLLRSSRFEARPLPDLRTTSASPDHLKAEAAPKLRMFHVLSTRHAPPWSSSMNLGRLADAYSASGFGIEVVSSSGARRAGLDVTDIVACEVLKTPCTGGQARWSSYAPSTTYESSYDGVAHGTADGKAAGTAGRMD